ncbi:hypothetical protein [Agrobacterium vitis]|nr:hypothetical protein [Agrobacterium vitis]NSZ19468.1 hypothetical protein [Agrobacterium vitis]
MTMGAVWDDKYGINCSMGYTQAHGFALTLKFHQAQPGRDIAESDVAFSAGISLKSLDDLAGIVTLTGHRSKYGIWLHDQV